MSMNYGRPAFSTRIPFRSAVQYLSNLAGASPASSPRHKHRRDSSLDDYSPVALEGRPTSTMSTPRKSRLSSELQPAAIPLIDISRSPSPYARSRSSAPQSEDEDDDYDRQASLVRPLVADDIGASRGRDRWGWAKDGVVGRFLFGTWIGYQVWVCLLIFWVGGWQFTLMLMNRFILLTGVYKFPYPLTATLLQLLITHGLLIVGATLTRIICVPLRLLGFGSMVAPFYPIGPSAQNYRSARRRSISIQIIQGAWSFVSPGVTGGGFFEFDLKTARKVLPLAVVYFARVVLSNLSFAYTALPIYNLARIGVIPLSLILTASLSRAHHSVSTLSSSLVATLNLLIASIQPGVRVTWESIVAGVFSSVFVALYPILLQGTHRTLVNELVPPGDILTGAEEGDDRAARGGTNPQTGTREEAYAYWRLLHYTSVITIAILAPVTLLSGEVKSIRYNCYFLDVPFFWLLTFLGGLASFFVFSFTLLLIRSTNVFTTTFVSIPRSAISFVILGLFGSRMPVHAWVGVILCSAASAWYLLARRSEKYDGDRARLEGR